MAERCAQSTSEKESTASAVHTQQRPGGRNIANFFNVLKSRTVAQLGEHEPSCRLHWTRQSFYHKTGSEYIPSSSGREDFPYSSDRDKAFKCTCSTANRYKLDVCKDNPSPSDKTGGERATDSIHETDSGNTESEEAVRHVGKACHMKKGKWWKSKRVVNYSIPKGAATAKEVASFGKEDTEDSRQILTKSETDLEGLNKVRDGGENIVKESSTEVETTSKAQQHSSLITPKPKLLKSKIPRPVNFRRVRAHKIRKPQVLDDLFISKITLNDELNFLRRDLALGWLTTQEARDRLQDFKRRFKVDLGSLLTSREFQQIFGGSADESEDEEWNAIGPWTLEQTTDV